MYYAAMRKFDVANGVGVRTTLFVSGCTHGCEGCFNGEYQDFRYGKQWTQVVEDEFMSCVKDANISGVTILGGEPMDQIQDDDLLKLLQRIKQETNKSIWMYSGYTYEAIKANPKRYEMLKLCDILVDGKFVQELRDLKLNFRGSSNQRIIDVQNSLDAKEVIWAEL